MEPESIRLALLGSIRFGKLLVIDVDMMGKVSMLKISDFDWRSYIPITYMNFKIRDFYLTILFKIFVNETLKIYLKQLSNILMKSKQVCSMQF